MIHLYKKTVDVFRQQSFFVLVSCIKFYFAAYIIVNISIGGYKMFELSDIKKFVETYLKEIFFAIGVLVIGSSLTVAWLLISRSEQTDQNVSVAQEMTMTEESTTQSWFVDIKGAVQKEGVYEVSASMRVKDVIDLAGGFKEDADKTQVNLAQVVQDEMVIIVPIIGEEQTSLESETTVDLNTASKDTLMTVKGIGEKKAELILDYRQKKRIKKLEDLLELKGFSEKFIESIRPLVRVS